jgi:hypothetical protein
MSVAAITRHKRNQFLAHRRANFAPHPHVEHEPGVMRGQSAELGGGHVMIAQKMLDCPVDIHLGLQK